MIAPYMVTYVVDTHFKATGIEFAPDSIYLLVNIGTRPRETRDISATSTKIGRYGPSETDIAKFASIHENRGPM